LAEGCPNPTPRDSQIWRDFEKVIYTEYPTTKKPVEPWDRFDESSDEKLRWLVWGHTLGRMASAVQNQTDRRVAFDCVHLAIEQIIALNYLSDTDRGSFYLRLVMQAAMGMHDDVIARTIGVRTTEPLYDLFGGKIENGHSSPGPVLGKEPKEKTTSTITKKDPVAVGGGFTLEDPTKGRAPDGQCSNWMTIAFHNSKGENDAGVTEAACTSAKKTGDFITKYNPNSKACSVCFLDDWAAGFSGPIDSHGGTAGNTGAVGEGKSHPCEDSSIPASAEWTYYGHGGAGEYRKEKGGVICGSLSYRTYSSSEMKYFTCDKGHVNCRFDKTVPIEKVVKKEDHTLYDFVGSNWATRTPILPKPHHLIGE
jgi:hypothetical protein